MAKLIYDSTLIDNHEVSTILELYLYPKTIKRIFWIYNNSHKSVRGKHRHYKTNHLLICLSGSCKVYVNNGGNEEVFDLNNPNQILHLEPSDWREMYEFSEDCILTCFCDELYDPNDYICTPYYLKNKKIKVLEEEYFFV